MKLLKACTLPPSLFSAREASAQQPRNRKRYQKTRRKPGKSVRAMASDSPNSMAQLKLYISSKAQG